MPVVDASAEREKAVRFLSEYADAYKQTHYGERVNNVGLTVGRVEEADPLSFLRFIYHHYAFNRAGGAAAGYNDIAVDAVDTVGEVDADALWNEFVRTCEDRGIGLNRRVNQGAVQEIAALVEEHGNLFKWTAETLKETGSIEPVYGTVGGVRGFGEKITRFVVRDAVWETGVEDRVPEKELEYLQPMDVWTRRAAHVLFEETWNASDSELSRKAATESLDAGVSGAEFNQGAWFFGAKEQNGQTGAFVEKLVSLD